MSEPGGQGPPRGADTMGPRGNPARPEHRGPPGGGVSCLEVGGHVDWESRAGQ